MKLRFFTFVFVLLMSDSVLTDDMRQLRIDAAILYYAAEMADTGSERESLLQKSYDKLNEIQDRHSLEYSVVRVIRDSNFFVITPTFLLDQVSSAAHLDLNTADLREILGRIPSPFEKDENGWTDLHYAVALNLLNSAEALIDAGANSS